MAFQPVANACEMVLHGSGPSALIMDNVFGLDVGPDLELSQAITDVIAGHFADALGEITDFISDQFQWESLTISDLREDGAPQFVNDFGAPIPGGAATDPLPLQTAALISWYTARRGRSYRGRTYIAGWVEPASDGAHMTSAAHTALAAFADSLVSHSWKLGVISRYEPNPSPPPSSLKRATGIVSDVSSHVAHDLWATQRRRAPRA